MIWGQHHRILLGKTDYIHDVFTTYKDVEFLDLLINKDFKTHLGYTLWINVLLVLLCVYYYYFLIKYHCKIINDRKVTHLQAEIKD